MNTHFSLWNNKTPFENKRGILPMLSTLCYSIFYEPNHQILSILYTCLSRSNRPDAGRQQPGAIAAWRHLAAPAGRHSRRSGTPAVGLVDLQGPSPSRSSGFSNSLL